MKRIVSIMLLFVITGCGMNKPQFVTTLSIEDTAVTQEQTDSTIAILQKRLALAGFKNAAVTGTAASKQLTITSTTLDKEWIINYLLKKGALVFYECYSTTELAPALMEADKSIAASLKLPYNKDEPGPLFRMVYQFASPYDGAYGSQSPGYFALVVKENIPLVKKYLTMTANLLPADGELFLKELDKESKKTKLYELYFLKNNAGRFFVNNHVAAASAKTSNKYPSINMTLDAYAAKRWERMTTANTNKCIAIVIDGAVISAPLVAGPISGANTEISGVFTIQEAQEYAGLLQTGCLPVTLHFKTMQPVNKTP